MPADLCVSPVVSIAEARIATATILLDGEIVDANPSMSQLLGENSPGSLWNRNLREWVAAPDEFSRLLKTSAAHVTTVECSLRTSSGEVRTVRVSTRQLDRSQSTVPAMELALEDISERRQLELQLQQAQKMEALGRLAGGVAHDFNNLLTVIRGTCELIVLRHNVDETLAARVQVIAKATDQGAQLTHQLLAFSRRQLLKPEEVNVNESLRDLQKMLARLIGEDISVRLELDERPLTTVIDGGQFHQVLMNLAVNSRDAMPSGGTLTIRTSRCQVTATNAREFPSLSAGDYVVISVHDSGVGIEADVLHHIFEPFYTTRARGTGLGLSTVYGILQQSHGGICVESSRDAGTTFRVYLPLFDPAQRGDEQKPELVASPRNATLLIVEDEDMVRKGTAEFLDLSGFTVFTASDGVEGLAVAAAHPEIDLVVSDIVMPRMRGPEMAAELRKRNPALLLLFMSGYTHLPLELSNFKGASVLHKPFALSEIQRSIQALLSGSNQSIPSVNEALQ